MEKYWPVSLWPGLQQLLTAPAHSSGLLVPGYSIICVTGYSIITCSPGRGTPPRPRHRLPRSRRRPRPRSRGRQRPRSQHWTWEIFTSDFLTRKMIVGVTFTRERPARKFWCDVWGLANLDSLILDHLHCWCWYIFNPLQMKFDVVSWSEAARFEIT